MTFPADPKVRDELARFLMRYRFALDETTTKINILRDEFAYAHDYNPIEHVSGRLKTPESIFAKVRRLDVPLDLAAIGREIRDIAGLRIICSFTSDVYRVAHLLAGQQDMRLAEVKDYIARPKPNGYRSLHLIVEIPVFLTDGRHGVFVEIQLRTVAMDFWASLEHKIYYKYDGAVPMTLFDDLLTASHTAAELDVRMESLHRRVHGRSPADGWTAPTVPPSEPTRPTRPTLIVLGGLPATGKSTVAGRLRKAHRLSYVRIDSIEQALRESGALTDDAGTAGYLVGYATARDDLRGGADVLAECVNPLELTRAAWRDVACRAGAHLVEVELVCSDTDVHRHRVEHRSVDIPGLPLPEWPQVVGREYEPWQTDRLVLDTALLSPDEVARAIRRAWLDQR